MDFTKRTWAEIDISALKHNFNYIKNKVGSTDIMAVVKTESYGHGTESTVPVFDKEGAAYFAVSNIDEAIKLRNEGIKKPTLILGYTPIEDTEKLIEYDIIQAVYSLSYAELIEKEAEKANKTVKVFLKIDTGMGRIGFNCRDESLPEIEDAIKAAKLSHIKAEGAFMHFAVADRNEKTEDGFTDRQYSLFGLVKERLESAGLSLKYAAANSAAVLNDKEKLLDICRPGIILYGLSPDNSLDRYPELIPVMTLKSVISHVKTVKAGETVSYGRTFKAEKEMTVATVSAGYGDGYPRALSGKGYVFVKGKKAPILGRVCMDQMMIGAEGLDLKIGDEVELFGKNISASTLAEIAGTINYEIICGVNVRVPRIPVNGD